MKILQHKFVECIPDRIEDGILYISIEYCTAIHKCVCGCGNEVVTPLSPTDWHLTFNGKTVSLHPSIGNWNFDCQSHYWIRNNEVERSGRWSEKAIHSGRKDDIKRKKEYFGESEILQEEVSTNNQKLTTWQKISNFFRL